MVIERLVIDVFRLTQSAGANMGCAAPARRSAIGVVTTMATNGSTSSPISVTLKRAPIRTIGVGSTRVFVIPHL